MLSDKVHFYWHIWSNHFANNHTWLNEDYKKIVSPDCSLIWIHIENSLTIPGFPLIFVEMAYFPVFQVQYEPWSKKVYMWIRV